MNNCLTIRLYRDIELTVSEISDGKIQYLDILLIGDEDPDMIFKYLDKSRLLIGYIDGKAVAACAFTKENDIVEIKNLGVLPLMQKQGIGSALLSIAEEISGGHTIMLGTGETPSTLAFYKNRGYRYSHRINNFFTDNYPSTIIEEEVTLKDMIYLSKQR